MSDEPDMILEAAADWFARRRSGRFSAEDLQALVAWLDESPAHQAAYREISSAWEGAGAVRSAPEMLAVREASRAARPARRPARIAPAAAAASIAALGAWAGFETGVIPDAVAALRGEQTFRTGLGQMATVTLNDGSVVTLDTDSLVRSRETDERRSLRLERGRAYFKVAKDPARPFVVAAGDKLVTATGTAFSVRLDQKAVEVTLVEGSVRVREKAEPIPLPALSEPAHEPTDMKAGSRLLASDRWSLASIDVQKATSWLDGQLIFQDQPLSEAVAELNRYSRKKIVIRDSAIADAPIVSVVQAGDVDAFVRIVTASGFAQVVSESDTEVELAGVNKKIEKSAASEVHDFGEPSS